MKAFARIALGVLAAAALGLTPLAHAQAKKPNILVITLSMKKAIEGVMKKMENPKAHN